MKHQFFSVLASLLLVFGCGLATAEDESPEQVAEAYIAAFKKDGMAGATAYMHPDELERFRESLVPVLAIEPGLGVEIRKGIFGAEVTAEDLKAMSAEAFMKGFMAFADKQMKAANAEVVSIEIVGRVTEGDVVHLVTRGLASAGDVKLTTMEVVSLKRDGKVWRLMLSGKIDGMAEMIKARIKAHPAAPAP